MIAALLLTAALSTDAWLADFHQILDEMSSHYANLDSAIRDRRMDLPELRRATEAAIRAAKSDGEAQQAIDSFLRAFGDGHVSADWKQAPSDSAAKGKPLCERLGYKRREDASAIDFARLPEFTPFSDDASADVPGGILTLPRDRKIGVLRIQLFSGGIHPDLCSAAQQALKLADDAACDGECESRVDVKVSDLLTAALERRVAAIARAGATALVVDLTGNGGGSDWVEPAARVLTQVELKSPRLGFIRHPHWMKQLRQELDDVEHDLAEGVEPQARLLEARSVLRRAVAAASQQCDRSSVWLDEPKAPDCSLVVPDILFASGVLAYAKPGSLPAARSTTVLFNPAQFAYHEGANRLPLFVIVDGRTASASELFAAMLQDNKAATIIGTPTLGSGCGHTNGGINATLTNSLASLSLPDCVRFRANGTNEIVGVTPDVLIPFRGFDSRFQRAAKVKAALETVVK